MDDFDALLWHLPIGELLSLASRLEQDLDVYTDPEHRAQLTRMAHRARARYDERR